jgi:X-X-X-Leu-X-X-Gly heptad repeat protein
MRALPLASQGLARVPSPLVPAGQSWTGPLALAPVAGAGALAEGAGALAEGAGTAADAVALGALGAACSLSQANRRAETAVTKSARERWVAIGIAPPYPGSMSARHPVDPAFPGIAPEVLEGYRNAPAYAVAEPPLPVVVARVR